MTGVISIKQGCKWRDFKGCECNIMGACDENVKPDLDSKTLKKVSPKGMEYLIEGDKEIKRDLAYLCEAGAVAILYDCNRRIPLYAATLMNEEQLRTGGHTRIADFKRSHDKTLDKQYQQTDDNWKDSKQREVCYRSKAKPDLLIESYWYNYLNPKSKPLPHNKLKNALPNLSRKDECLCIRVT